MGEKPVDPEAPALTSHRDESVASIDKRGSSSNGETAREWTEDLKKSSTEPVTTATKQKNPLAGLTREELFRDVEEFAREKELEHIVEELKRGALVAQDPKAFEQLTELSEVEKELLRREKTHRWNQPFMMYFMTSKRECPVDQSNIH